MVLVDEELQRLAEQRGSTSADAQALAQLESQRAQDLQVHCFRVADRCVTGPLPKAAEPASSDHVDAPKADAEIDAAPLEADRLISRAAAGRAKNASVGVPATLFALP